MSTAQFAQSGSQELSEWITNCMFLLCLANSQLLLKVLKKNKRKQKKKKHLVCLQHDFVTRWQEINDNCFHVAQPVLTNDRKPFERECNLTFKISLFPLP